MRLVYVNEPTREVKQGDLVNVSGEPLQVGYFRPPHKPSSSGKVSLRPVGHHMDTHEYFVGVIGAEWIEREDR